MKCRQIGFMVMLLESSGALSKGDADIGRAKVSPHRIELSDYTPIWQKRRRLLVTPE